MKTKHKMTLPTFSLLRAANSVSWLRRKISLSRNPIQKGMFLVLIGYCHSISMYVISIWRMWMGAHCWNLCRAHLSFSQLPPSPPPMHPQMPQWHDTLSRSISTMKTSLEINNYSFLYQLRNSLMTKKNVPKIILRIC